MAAITVRNLPPEVHRALKLRAAEHNRSTEAEARAILAEAVLPGGAPGLGARLRQRWCGEFSDDLVVERDRTPHQPLRLE